MPIPEPSDVEKCVHLNFEDQENECKKLECDLQRISKAKDKVVAESEASYLEPFQVNIQFAKLVAKSEIKTDLYKRSQFTFILSIEKKVQKMFYSFTCILPDIVAHEITQIF